MLSKLLLEIVIIFLSNKDHSLFLAKKNVSDHEPIFNSLTMESTHVDEEPVFTFDICDPANWDKL